LLRCFNRLNDLVAGCLVQGQVLLDGEDLYRPEVDVTRLRRQVGMVFQHTNPFPGSVFDNVAYGLRIQGIRDRYALEQRVQRSLEAAALWQEVQGELGRSALTLSGGQQQRLCIARALAVEPRVLLLDEPTGTLDPIAAARIEELIRELRRDYTIVMVTHNLQQAARLSDDTGFIYQGRLVEFAATRTIFTTPGRPETEEFITGRLG
jgi:phosphate transport system ATP-binding protein